jgi:hypothetical protein
MNANEYLTTVGGEVLPIKKSDPVFAGDVLDIGKAILREAFGHTVPAFKKMREQIAALEKRVAELEFEQRVQRRVEELLDTRQGPVQRQELAEKIRERVNGR